MFKKKWAKVVVRFEGPDDNGNWISAKAEDLSDFFTRNRIIPRIGEGLYVRQLTGSALPDNHPPGDPWIPIKYKPNEACEVTDVFYNIANEVTVYIKEEGKIFATIQDYRDSLDSGNK